MMKLAACTVIQNLDGKILFTSRKNTFPKQYGLVGGGLEPIENYLVMVSGYQSGDNPSIETATVNEAKSIFCNTTKIGFLLGAIREAEEETGLCCDPLGMSLIYAGKTDENCYVFTFFCSSYSGELTPEKINDQEVIELRWEDKEFLLSEEIAFKDYNKKIYEVLTCHAKK